MHRNLLVVVLALPALCGCVRRCCDPCAGAPAAAPLAADDRDAVETRTYDLQEFVALGPDEPVSPELAYVDCVEPRLASGAEERLARVAVHVQRALGTAAVPAGAGLSVRVEGTLLVVRQRSAAFATVERALDEESADSRRAFRVQVAVVRDVPSIRARLEGATGSWVTFTTTTSFSGIRAEEVDASPWDAALEGHVIERLEFDVGAGRRVGAKRTVSTSYVQDFDLEVASVAKGVPLLGVLEAGLAVNAVSGAGADGRRLAVEVGWSEVRQPLETFTSSLVGVLQTSVTIELPEVRLLRGSLELAPAVGAAALASSIAGVGFAVRIASVSEDLDGGARWHRGDRFPAFSRGTAAPVALRIDCRLRRRAGAGAWSDTAAPALIVNVGESATVEVSDVGASQGATPGRPSTEVAGIGDPVSSLRSPGFAVVLLPQASTGDVRTVSATLLFTQKEGERTFDASPVDKVNLPILGHLTVPWLFALQEGEEGRRTTTIRRTGGVEEIELVLRWKRVWAGQAGGGAPASR